jgi:hypothetical protein
MSAIVLTADTDLGLSKRAERIFAEFNESWMKYWTAYVELQNQLYESAMAAREVSWLAATDIEAISRINQLQRDLFASMPRRMDYVPLGQVRNLDNAMRRLDELEAALAVEKEKCRRLEDAIEVLGNQVRKAKQGLQTLGSSPG